MIDADIRAVISTGTHEDELELKDDGVAPDIIKNDGIYSAYYIAPQVTYDGVRYSLTCKTEGTNKTSVVDTKTHRRRVKRSLPSRPSSSTPLCCGSQAIKVYTETSFFL